MGIPRRRRSQFDFRPKKSSQVRAVPRYSRLRRGSTEKVLTSVAMRGIGRTKSAANRYAGNISQGVAKGDRLLVVHELP